MMMRHHRHLLLAPALLLVLAAAAAAQSFPSAINHKQAPKVQRQGDLLFCVFGDCQPAGDYSRYRVTSNLMRAIALERPQFVIGLGDYIDGAKGIEATRKQWLHFFSAISPLQKPTPIPVALAVGNHDYGSPLFDEYFGRRYFSFDVGDVHFIILDTQQPGHYSRIGGTQWQWLLQDLAAANNARMIFVALHQPLFPVSVHRGSSLDKYPPQRDRLHLLFTQYKVSAVFSGHEHQYHHQERDGVHYFISGGGGAPFYADRARGGFHHYLVVECDRNGYTVQVKRLDG